MSTQLIMAERLKIFYREFYYYLKKKNEKNFSSCSSFRGYFLRSFSLPRRNAFSRIRNETKKYEYGKAFTASVRALLLMSEVFRSQSIEKRVRGVKIKYSRGSSCLLSPRTTHIFNGWRIHTFISSLPRVREKLSRRRTLLSLSLSVFFLGGREGSCL